MGQGAWLERTSGIILPKALQQPTIFFFRVFSRLWPRNTTFIATKKHKIHKERVERRASRVESLRGVHLITKLPATRHDFFRASLRPVFFLDARRWSLAFHLLSSATVPFHFCVSLRLCAAIIFPPLATSNPLPVTFLFTPESLSA